jgi:hypothetical protein
MTGDCVSLGRDVEALNHSIRRGRSSANIQSKKKLFSMSFSDRP